MPSHITGDMSHGQRFYLAAENYLQLHLISSEICCVHHIRGSIICGYRALVKMPQSFKYNLRYVSEAVTCGETSIYTRLLSPDYTER